MNIFLIYLFISLYVFIALTFLTMIINSVEINVREELINI